MNLLSWIGDSSWLIESPWILKLAPIAIILVVVEAFLRKRFHWHLLIRGLWILGLCIAAAGFLTTRSKELSQPSLLNVFLDTSDSVIKVSERKERLQTFLTELKSWGEKNSQPLKIWNFSDHIEEGASVVSSKGGLKSNITPIQQALSGSEGSVLLVSDGVFSDTAQWTQPTWTLQLGRSNEKDVWIESPPSVFTAFLKNRLRIPLMIGQRGYAGKIVKASLWRGVEKVDEKEVTLASGSSPLEFSYFPEKMGMSTLIVRVESLKDEISEINNISAFKIRTVRDKMRILHIGGRPSYDLKAWRGFLTRQPDVDLVSFYILRSLNDDPQARNSELSLIPFPYEELFSTELTKVDLVILQNFDFNLYFQPFYLANLAQFIRQGGALLMMGGDQSLHRYQGSPLDPLMPVKFLGSSDLERTPERAAVFKDHPILRNSEWAFRREWTSRHLLKAHPQAMDLVRYQSGIPFLSIREIGKGRVMVLNSDESWRIQMEPSEDMAAFSRLARRILQYLTFDPEMDPQRIVSTKWNVLKPVHLKLADNAASDWTIRPLQSDEAAQKEVQKSEVEYLIPSAGWFQVEASSLNESFIYETEEKPWLDEWKSLISDDASLKKISERNGGKFFKFEDREDLWNFPLSGRQIISMETEPWSRKSAFWSWIILAASLFLVCFDFYFRKRSVWDT